MAHDDTTGGEVKGKLVKGVSSQYPSHYLGTWRIQDYYRWCAHLGCQQSTELTPPADLTGLVRFAERRNLVAAHVPSHFNWPLTYLLTYLPTPWCRVLLEKLTGLGILFPSIHCTCPNQSNLFNLIGSVTVGF